MERKQLSKRASPGGTVICGTYQVRGMKAPVAIFRTSLGWMCVMWTDELVSRISFGHRGATSAADALGCAGVDTERLTRPQRTLVQRLTAFATGQRDDFADVPIDLASRSGFAQRVLHQCRQVPWGSTTTYGQLAARAGSAGAARAVGRVMANNPLP